MAPPELPRLELDCRHNAHGHEDAPADPAVPGQEHNESSTQGRCACGVIRRCPSCVFREMEEDGPCSDCKRVWRDGLLIHEPRSSEQVAT